MKCHYEVLNVSREADDSEIKAAYRKLALKWHPDKNLDNADLAKEQFQLVQQAYEVLSDKQERAWYDKHREQILRGADKDYEDNSLDVFPYFTTSCFKGYTDDENGFYTVYRKVFEKIAKEDMEYMDKEEFCQIPGFGDSKSTYEDVVGPFYDYWMSYSTKKSYVWLDPYDIKEIRDRRAVKLIEKENKKVRQKAKKERNEEVRNLVAFVRKRDKRVQNHVKMMKEKSAENRKKQEMMRKQKKLEQQQHLGSVEQPEWAKFDNVKSELEEIEKALAEQFGEEISASEDEQAPEENDLYCVACNKVFKTPKAFSNHESSKKHKENVELLRANMEEDDDINESENENDYLDDLSIEHADIDLPHSDEIDDEIEETKSKNKKKKKKKALNIADSEETEHLEIELNVSDENEDFDNSITKSKKKSKRNKKMKNEPAKDIPVKIEEEEKEKEATTNKKPNKKDKKQKKEKVGSAEIDTDHCCVTCKANFPSKNKLFDHLKKTNHGIYLPSKSKQKNVN